MHPLKPRLKSAEHRNPVSDFSHTKLMMTGSLGKRNVKQDILCKKRNKKSQDI